MSSPQELAIGFVLEYLDRNPEYIDVAEYLDDRYDDEPPSDEIISEVYQEVVSILDVIAQRYLDEE